MTNVKLDNPLLHKSRIVSDPPAAKWLFNSKYASLLWLPLRIWLGYQWIEASLSKISNPAWVQTAFAWYRSFIQFLLDSHAYTWFAKLIAYGELLVGIALVIGMFTGIVAFLGGFMNWNYIMAGSASTNGFMFAIAVGLILAWKIAGYIGADYFLLPLIGTPWGRQQSAQAVEEQPKTTS
jgi:thiosulfate dehydrogenase [quinone] large subunit